MAGRRPFPGAAPPFTKSSGGKKRKKGGSKTGKSRKKC